MLQSVYGSAKFHLQWFQSRFQGRQAYLLKILMHEPRYLQDVDGNRCPDMKYSSLKQNAVQSTFNCIYILNDYHQEEWMSTDCPLALHLILFII